MSDIIDIQKDALKQLVAYSDKLIPAVEQVVVELTEDKQDDTMEFLNTIITGINWEIEIFNCCEKLINGNKKWIDKSEMSKAVSNLGGVLKEGDYNNIARCLEDDFLMFLKNLRQAAMSVVE